MSFRGISDVSEGFRGVPGMFKGVSEDFRGVTGGGWAFEMV